MQRDLPSMIRSNRKPRPVLMLAATAGLAGAALVLVASGPARAAGSQHNSEAPVNFAADHMEVQDKDNRVLLWGNVDITQDDLRVRSAKAVITYTNAGKVEIQRVDATGNVHVDRGTENAVGDVAIYDFNAHKITMVGHVVMRNENGNLNGSRVTIDLDSKQTMVTPTSSGRVTGTFTPPKRTTTTTTPPKP